MKLTPEKLAQLKALEMPAWLARKYDVWAHAAAEAIPALFTAQGFPAGYVIDHGFNEHGQRITLTKTAQVRMCGNSVCPPLSKAIVEANFQHEKTWRHKESA